MRIVGLTALAAASAACLVFSACQSAAPATQAAPIVQPGAPGQPSQNIDAVRAVDLSKVRFTAADVEFMQGMIAHHAQAIVMSRMAESNGANPQVLKLSRKIDQSQVAEIHIMQEWLRHNRQVAPDTSSWRTMTMAGMLTEAQLKTLDASRGVDFDRAFLTFMIQHLSLIHI